jgi:GT2 family glycosyltransferase
MPSTLPQLAPTRVAINILNWNGPAKTQRCLQAVAAVVQHSCPAVAFTVDVLDNGSAAADWQLLEEVAAESSCPCLRLTSEGSNLGFGSGHNRPIVGHGKS